jgi:hypothetical protein
MPSRRSCETPCACRQQPHGWSAWTEVGVGCRTASAVRAVCCETLGEARRVACLYTAQRRPYELIVRDACHRCSNASSSTAIASDRGWRVAVPACSRGSDNRSTDQRLQIADLP